MKITNEQAAAILADRDNILSVYHGRVGACCCGCAGRHAYTKQHQALAGRERGYAVTDDEVSERVVSNVAKRVLESAEIEYMDVFRPILSCETETKTFVVYLKNKVTL